MYEIPCKPYMTFKFGTVSLMCSHVKQYVYVIVNVCLWFLLQRMPKSSRRPWLSSNRNSLLFNPKPHPPQEPSLSYCRPPRSSPTNRQASLAIQSSTQTSSVAGIIPVLPKPALHNQGLAQNQQATIFHSTVSHHALSQHGSHTGLAHAKAQPVQLTAINLQIRPAQSQVSDALTR